MSKARNLLFTDALCGCTGGDEFSIDCARNMDCGNDEYLGMAEPIQAVSSIRRGPMSALSYEPDPSDPIDSELSWHLMSIDHDCMSKLIIERITHGEYSIDGRHVSIHFGSFGSGPCRNTELLVSEEREDGDWDAIETPLPMYLRQALNVMASLGGHCAGVPAVARVPLDERLSFVHFMPLLKEEEDPEAKRLLSMKRACEEAHLREQAVEAYERNQSHMSTMESLHELPPLGVEANLPLFPRQGACVPFQSHSSRSSSSSRCRFPVAPLPKNVVCSNEAPMHPGMSISRLTSGIPAAARIQKV